MAAGSAPEPIIPGFSPDPSICTIDGVFYLVTSSFHLFPGLPIYHSEDLQSWKLIGHAIHRPNQLSLRHSDSELATKPTGTIATGGLWAPTIRHHKGVTYVICTNVVYRQGRTDSTRRNFIICTTDILSNQWSDPLYFDFDGIDPSLFFDDDGRAYVQMCAHPSGGIWQFEVNVATAQPLTAPLLLWEGWDRRFTEGPHVYKKDGCYYLLVAEGGTFEDHMISIARSKSIHGPFEPCPRNPLFTAGAAGSHDALHHIGHGDLFQDGAGEWWTVLLAVRRTGNRYPLGRETFLARVDWPEGDWPSIRHFITNHEEPPNFENDSLLHLRDADLSRYSYPHKGSVAIRANPADLPSHKDTLSFVGHRQMRLDGSSSVIVHMPPAVLGSLKAGICVYKDEHRFAALSLDLHSSRLEFEARNMATGYAAGASMATAPVDCVHLCISYTQLEWVFQYRLTGGEDWVRLGIVDTLQFSGRDFTGPVIGVFAIGSGESEGQEVRFDIAQL